MTDSVFVIVIAVCVYCLVIISIYLSKKDHPTRANGHWEHGCNSNPVAMLPHAAAVFNICLWVTISHKQDRYIYEVLNPSKLILIKGK